MYLRCARRFSGCTVTARMELEPGVPIILGNHQHTVFPHGGHSMAVRMFLNMLRERGGLENVPPAQIYNEVSIMIFNLYKIKQCINKYDLFRHVRAALHVVRPAAIRIVARAKMRISPPLTVL